MSALATAALSMAGIALIVLALRDIFETLLHPEGRGPVARWVMRTIWTVCRVLRRRSVLQHAGPLGLLLVVGVWAALLVLGWALLLWPQLETGFRVEEEGHIGFWDALHVSLTTLTTLGFTDVTPEKDWLRVVTPLEALLGFGLLSASISYLLLIYPALARRRSLAYEVFLLGEAVQKTDLSPEQLGPGAAERQYADLASRVVAVERDLVNLPVTYYFADQDERFSLAAVAPYMLELARHGSRVEDPQVRLRAQVLADALDDLAQTTAKLFPQTRGDSSDAIFTAYARDHVIGGPP